MHSGCWILIIIFILSTGKTLSAPGGVDARQESGKSSEQTQQLEQLKKDIRSIQKSLDLAKSEHGQLILELRDAETLIGKTNNSLRALEKNLRAQREKLEILKRDRIKEKAALSTQRDALSKQLRTAYAIGQQGSLKVILNQTDISDIGRSLTYYNYLNQARTKNIKLTLETLDKIYALEKTIHKKTLEIKELRKEETDRKISLTKQVEIRNIAIRKLASEIDTHENELAKHLEDEKYLEQLINGIRAALEDIPLGTMETQPFIKLKGRLPWPTKGKIGPRFGELRNVGTMKWSGVLINTPEGKQVKSIYRGRIAFADWLRGFGLLVIIDHGDGYMSLYGHNQALYKETGDWVEAGETIAAVGSSGGQTQAGLYFEIRHNGIPANPEHWCNINSPG